MDKKVKQTQKSQITDSIGTRQNTDHAILLLKAQRKLYNKAKKLKTIKLALALISFAGAVAVLPFWPEYKIYFALFGGLVTGLNSLWLKSKVQKTINQAARIQEEFDVYVLGLTDNNSLTGAPVTKEVIHQYGAGESDKGLVDWYPDLEETEASKAALIAQRANLVWDWRQREVFANWLTVSTLIVLFAGIIYGVIQNLSFQDYLLMVLLPTLPFLILGYTSSQKHRKVLERQQLKEKEINSLVDSRASIPQETLRSIQDAIYKNRKESAMIPDFVYKWLRKKFQKQMEAAAQSFKNTK